MTAKCARSASPPWHGCLDGPVVGFPFFCDGPMHAVPFPFFCEGPDPLDCSTLCPTQGYCQPGYEGATPEEVPPRACMCLFCEIDWQVEADAKARARR